MKNLSLFFICTLAFSLCYAQCVLPVGFDPSGNEYTTSASTTASGIFDGPMPATITGAHVRIAAPFDIDQDLTLNSDIVEIEQNHPVTIKSGYTLDITSNTLITTDASAWVGFIVENNAELILDGSSIICNAQTAIHVKITSTGDVTVEDASMINNYRGMLFDTYTGGLHPATIIGSTIQGGTLVSELALVVSTTYSSIGIELEDVTDGGATTTLGLQIGDPAEDANVFRDLDVGVDALNSTVLVINNEFYDIKNINTSVNLGIAVVGVVDDPLLLTADLLVGTVTAGENIFEDCRFAVYGDGNDKVKVSDNTLSRSTGPFISGIQIKNSLNEVVIESNTISDFKDYGIRSKDNEDAEVNIRDNTISSTTASASCDVTAIEVHESTGAGSVVHAVRDNTIDDVQIGIEIANAESIEVEGNIISFEQASGCSTVEAYGIVAQGVDDAIFEDNTVNGNCLSCTSQDIAGIAILNSTGVLFRENDVENCGYGFLIAGDCTDGNAVCNAVDDCNKGFGFQDVGDGEFGPVEYVGDPGEPSDNAWTPDGTADRTHCFAGTDGTTLDWYYRGASSTPVALTQHDASIDNTDAGSGIAMIPMDVPSSTKDLCGAIMRTADWGSEKHSRTSIFPSMRSMLDDLYNSIDPSNMSNSAYSYLQLALLRGQDEDIIIDLLPYTNIVDLDAVEDLLNEENLILAGALLTTILPINEQEELKVDVLGAILRAKMVKATWEYKHSGSMPNLMDFMTKSDYNLVESIADLAPEKKGDAVIMARAILDRLSFEIINEEERLEAPVEHTTINVYPNPTSGVFTLQVNNEFDQVEIINISGQKISPKFVNLSVEQIYVDLGNVQDGFYLVRMINSRSGESQTTKIFVSK